MDLLIGVEGPENDGDDKSEFLVVESGSMGVFVDLVVVLDIIEVGGDCGGLVCLSGSLVALEVVELVSESIVEEAFWDEALSEGCRVEGGMGVLDLGKELGGVIFLLNAYNCLEHSITI